MKISSLTKWRMEHPRLTTRLFPPPPLPPVSPHRADEPELVDLRDRERLDALIHSIQPAAGGHQEPLWLTIVGCLIAATAIALALFLL